VYVADQNPPRVVAPLEEEEKKSWFMSVALFGMSL
jgi:hypothetical protein